MAAIKIKEGIWWVGVQHPELRVFDVVMTTQWGTSYNSYLVQGSEKIAVIDAVKEMFADDFIANIKQVIGDKKIDYIVCNHNEPDHSGALSKLVDFAPDATVLCSRPSKTLIRELLNRDFNCEVVADNTKIDLGGKTLQFIMAPFLHWPDSMFTYVPEDGFLSTCDVFGFHFSAPQLFDDLTELDTNMVASQKYYYDVIMSPFKSYVLEAIEKIRNLKIDVIGPSHGPVLRDNPQGAIDRYERWSQKPCNPQRKIYIGYVSAYGYTAQMAKALYEGIAKQGVEVEMEDIATVPTAEVVAKIYESEGFALGSPTLNRDVMPPVSAVLYSLCPYIVKGKKAALFGSYGWSGEACGYMSQRLTNIGVKVVGDTRAKLRPSTEELGLAKELGAALHDAVVSE